jgi:hypothetical protein
LKRSAEESGGGNGEMTEEVVRFDVIGRRDDGVLGLISASLLEQDFGYGVLHFEQSTITKIFDSQMFFFSFFLSFFFIWNLDFISGSSNLCPGHFLRFLFKEIIY